MTWCFGCEKDKHGDELALCKDKEHDIDYEHLYSPPTPQTEKKTKVPDVKTIIKATLGQTYVESTIVDGKPMFLCNINGEVKTHERITHDGVIYVPIEKNSCGYAEYEYTKQELDFFKEKSKTKQYLLNKIWDIVNHFIDSTEMVKTLVTVDLLQTYCLEWIDSVHYLYFVGETESGKSTALHLFKNFGYRCMYSNGLPHADIYNFYGTDEEACGTICEDECQDLGRDKDKVATYKNSYTRGSIKPIILNTSNTKKQVYYKTYGLKVFAGENIPHDKGFKERLAIIHMVEGTPEGNIKRPTKEEKNKLKTLRLGLLYWKVANIHEGLPDVESKLKNRDQELWEDFLRVAKDTDFQERAQKVVKFYTNQRHEGIWNSLDAELFKLVLSQLNGGMRLKMGKFWSKLIGDQDEIEGELDGKSFYPNEFSKTISQNYFSNLFKDKFQAKKETHWKVIENKKRRITEYVFNENIIKRLSHKYNVSHVSTSDASGQGMELTHAQATDLHHLDHFTEVS